MSDTQRGSITPGPKGRYTTFFLFHKNAVRIVNWTRPEQPTLWPINCSAPMITDNTTLISTGPQLMLFQELQILLILLLCRVLQWGFWGLGNKGHLSKMLRRGVQVRVFNFTFSGKKTCILLGIDPFCASGEIATLEFLHFRNNFTQMLMYSFYLYSMPVVFNCWFMDSVPFIEVILLTCCRNFITSHLKKKKFSFFVSFENYTSVYLYYQLEYLNFLPFPTKSKSKKSLVFLLFRGNIFLCFASPRLLKGWKALFCTLAS